MGRSQLVQLYAAVSDGNVDAVKRLLGAGADPNEPITPDEYYAWIDRARLDHGQRSAVVLVKQTQRLFQSGHSWKTLQVFFP